MATSNFLRRYLYGAAAAGKAGGPSPLPDAVAIPGRRAPIHLSNRFHQIVKGLVAEVLEPHGLTNQQWGVMVAIQREPGTDQRRIAERQSIDANSASRLIDELEAMDLVRRVSSPHDRRSNRLELTPAGKAARAKVLEPVLAAQDRALSCLTAQERMTLLDLLTRVVEANREHARPGAGRRKPVKKLASAVPAPSRVH